jgi:small conductance mechanosensitive channel
MEETLKELINQTLLFIPRVAVALLVFVTFWFAGVILQKIVHRIFGKRRDLEDVIDLLGRAAKTALLVLGAVTALGTVGINVSALVAGLGLVGFALGFAFQDFLSNLLAGVLILIYRPFRHNDRIAVASFEGIVVKIDLRYTTLQAEDKKILIPNSTLFTNAVSVLDTKE